MTRAAGLPPLPIHPIPVDQVVIEIVADPSNPAGRLVLQDGVESSYVDIARPDRLGFEYQRHLASVVDVVHPKKRALDLFQIGGGPCAVPRYLDVTRRDFTATVAEIDAGVIEVARTHLGLDAHPRIVPRVGDGRTLLAEVAPESLDVVIVDAFLGLVVPHPLVTRQFADIARRALRPGGLHITNLIDIPPLGFAHAVAATQASAYGEAIVIADPSTISGASSGNLVIAASDTPMRAEIIERRAAHDDAPWQVLRGRSLARWFGDAAPLDDDVAPVHDLALLGDLFGRARRRRTEGES